MQAIIFDFDGTLANSEPLHDRALAQACAAAGFQWTSGACLGRCDEQVLQEILPPQEHPRIPAILSHKRQLMTSLIADGAIPFYDGAIELVVALLEGDIPIAVCSAAGRDEVCTALRRVHLEDRFAHIVTAEDVTRPKPDPEGYLLTAQLIGVAPHRCIAIEDSVTGSRAAVAAGMHTICVGHTTPREALAHAHAHIETISQLTVQGLHDHFASR